MISPPWHIALPPFRRIQTTELKRFNKASTRMKLQLAWQHNIPQHCAWSEEWRGRLHCWSSISWVSHLFLPWWVCDLSCQRPWLWSPCYRDTGRTGWSFLLYQHPTHSPQNHGNHSQPGQWNHSVMWLCKAYIQTDFSHVLHSFVS